MFRNFHVVRLSLIVLIFLALVLGNAGQTTPVHAAPLADTRVSWLVTVYVPKGPVCVGGDYPVKVKITKFNEVVFGATGETDWKSSLAFPSNAQKVNGSVQDPNIGTLTPSEVLTGWDLDAPGEAFFNFHANKTGETQLNFKIDIRDYDKNGAIFKNTVAGERIKVVHCKYKVTITPTFTASYPNLSGLVIGKAQGEMKADKNGNLKGTVSVKWDVYWFSQCFTHDSQFSASPDANLTGSLSQDGSSLTLHADFKPVAYSETSIATCYVKGAKSYTSAFPAPPIDVTLPSTGGATTKSLSIQWEQVSMQGSAVISVVPIEEK